MSEPNINELADDHNIDQGESMLLCIEDEKWAGICGPEVTEATSHEEAPFDFDTTGNPPSTDQVAQRFSQMFDNKVEQVFQQIEGKDEPLEAVRSMDLENIITDKQE